MIIDEKEEDKILHILTGLVSTIDEMFVEYSGDMYGPFSDWTHQSSGTVEIHWTNLTIMADHAKRIIEEIQESRQIALDMQIAKLENDMVHTLGEELTDVPRIKPHWHEQNPWRDRLLYVTLEDLATATMGLTDSYTVEDELKHWRQYGPRLDAYVLTGSSLTAGIRYGPEGNEYLSPGFHPEKLLELIEKYR